MKPIRQSDEILKDLSHIKRLREGKLIYRSAKMCMTKDIGVNNKLFGGFLLQLLDEVVLCFACEVCDTPRMVTKKMEEVIFEDSVQVGQIIKVYVGIDKIGTTSVTFNVEARSYNVRTENEKLVCSTRMIFVQIDEQGNPIPIMDKIKKKFSKKVSKKLSIV